MGYIFHHIETNMQGIYLGTKRSNWIIDLKNVPPLHKDTMKLKSLILEQISLLQNDNDRVVNRKLSLKFLALVTRSNGQNVLNLLLQSLTYHERKQNQQREYIYIYK